MNVIKVWVQTPQKGFYVYFSMSIKHNDPVQAVRLESAWSDRVRYMVVVYTSGRQDTEENILLGIDFTSKDW